MSLFMKSIIKPPHCTLLKQFIRNTSKIAVDIDASVLEKIENGDLKERQHPGIIKFNRTFLPDNISKALSKVIGDYPIKTLIEDCKKLDSCLSSRHPPVEEEGLKEKMSKIMEEIEKVMPTEESENLSENEFMKWKQRKQHLLQKRLKERTFAWNPMQYGHYESIVYAVGRGAREYGVLMRILLEIKSRDKEFNPRSYFDFGSGVGTGMWAASSLWKESIFEYFNVDSSKYMNDLSDLILRDGNENQQITLRNVFYRQFLPGLETKYDLVVCSYTLFELPNVENRLSVIRNLWDKCDGYLILVEEGSRKGFELVNEARDYILSLEEHSLVGHVFAPCPHDNVCPRILNAEDRTPCNFEVKFEPTTLSNKSKYTRKAMFSYVVLKKGLPEDNTRSWPRLVRPTLLRSKHAICRMCTSEGKLQEIIFTKSKHGKHAYKCAKVCRWGDRLPIAIGEPFERVTKLRNNVKSKDDEDHKESSENKE